MRLAAAACGFAILACVAVVGAVLSKNVSISVSAPAPEVATAAPAKGKAVRTVTEVTDTRPLYPDYQPTRAQSGANLAAARPRRRRPAKPPGSGHAGQAAPRRAEPDARTGRSVYVGRSRAAPSAAPAAPIGRTEQAARAGTEHAGPCRPHRRRPPLHCPGNPNALGVSRVVEIDTTGGPGFGFEHFKSARLPARRRSRADLRRRSVAAEHAGGAGRARRTTAPRRSSSRSACTPPTSRDAQAGGRRRTRRRLAHLVAPDARQDQGPVQGQRQDGSARVRSRRTRSRRASARCTGPSADRPRPTSASRASSIRRNS